jgi:ABC-type branched-subunit amino acid transport system substrate-binding protein
MKSSAMVGVIWWASRARQVTTCERFRNGCRTSTRHSDEFVFCISAGGTFGWQVARGILESVLVVAGQSVEPVPINPSLENYDCILRLLFDIDPEVVVLAATFQDELDIMRTRQNWPRAVRVVAAVAAGLGDFSAELAHIADGVLGPSQWEPGVTFPNVTGPASDCFWDSFNRQFGHSPDYIAAGSFATALVLTECVRRADSLDDEKLRSTASGLDCDTFYGGFRIDSRTEMQTGHHVLLVLWQGGLKVVLPSRSRLSGMHTHSALSKEWPTSSLA